MKVFIDSSLLENLIKAKTPHKKFCLMPNGCRRWVTVTNGVARWSWTHYVDGKRIQKQFRGFVKVKNGEEHFDFESYKHKQDFLEYHEVIRKSYLDRTPRAIAERRVQEQLARKGALNV